MKTKLIIILAAIIVIAIVAVVFAVRSEKNNEIETNIDLTNVPPALNPETKAFIIKAGVNIPGFEGDGYFYRMALEYIIDKFTYSNIKDKGFDHIRVPIDFRLFYDEETNTLIEDKIKDYDTILDYAEANGLYVIIDFHGWYDIAPSSRIDVDLFVNIWTLVAERYKDRSNYVIFELMNEPSGKTAGPARLNMIQKKAIDAIRVSNPDRLIICAAPDGNQTWLLGELSIPEDDNNLAVAVHIYNPGDFTHQGYEWAGKEKDKQVRLTDEYYEELVWNINETKKFIENTGIPVILDEFGMNLEISDKEDQKKYLGTIVEFCEEYGVPWTLWRYNTEVFGLYDNGKWNDYVVDILFRR